MIATNQLVYVTDFADDTFRVAHDPLGRPTKSTVVLPGKTTHTLLMTTQYDPYFNRPIHMRTGLGITHSFTYDLLGRVAQNH